LFFFAVKIASQLFLRLAVKIVTAYGKQQKSISVNKLEQIHLGKTAPTLVFIKLSENGLYSLYIRGHRITVKIAPEIQEHNIVAIPIQTCRNRISGTTARQQYLAEKTTNRIVLI